MAGDEPATLLFRERENFGDRYAEVRAWDVPDSDRYPDGVKYSLQYGTLDGETIIRYDNFPDHPGSAHHHKHTRDGVENVDFDGVHPLYKQFKNEVNEYGHDWN
ncbi:hypothetical protein JMJ58_14950 [Haloterrigena salifodinae]|uniref:Uncharacterized protein n=1 Tax=Haloterrigena salifodinae TaxID=2675099 RepID=A0A8T8DY15_9EURY|nr:DUF6516 family protein [Haloterrigena salifodinae]QRV14232.1 hypothetical protein JMJ58_14950 [Haloterrigena salifodinae]